MNATGRAIIEPPWGEAALMDLLRRECEEMGGEVSLHDVLPGRQNLICRFAGRDSTRSLMLEAHADTVPVEGMTIEPFAADIRDGKLYGRGACDTKGPMAAMLHGIASVIDSEGAPPVDVFFVSCCDEEQGARGAAALMAEGFRTDAAIVGEPTELQITDLHKGALRWRISTLGQAAHSAFPHLGRNAISSMAEVVRLLDGAVTKAFGGTHHDRLGDPTLSVGTISGGTQVNVVPDRCSIDVDRRMLPGENREELTRALRASLDGLKVHGEPLVYEIEETEYYPPLSCPPDAPLRSAMEYACRNMTGGPRYAAASYGTDGGCFAGAGIPTLVFGPGSITDAHKAVELIDLKELHTAVTVYAEVIRRF